MVAEDEEQWLPTHLATSLSTRELRDYVIQHLSTGSEFALPLRDGSTLAQVAIRWIRPVDDPPALVALLSAPRTSLTLRIPFDDTSASTVELYEW